MRKLIAIITILFGLWGGYWVIGATALETGLKDYLSTNHRAKDPIHVAYSDLSVRGFPNRFDTSLTNIRVTDLANRLDWRAPFLHVHALSYKPYHIIAALPHDQTLQISGQELQITSDEIKGSVVFVASALLDKELAIDRSSFVIRNLAVSSNMGWKTAISDGTIATRQTPTNPLHYDLAVSATTITLPDQLRKTFDPDQLLADAIHRISLDASLGFTAPWTLIAHQQNMPVLTDISVNKLAVVWDDVQISATGDLQIDQHGYPSGTLIVTASNWQKIYRLAQSTNTIDPIFAQTIQNGLKILAETADNKHSIDIPLIFANRQMRIGLFPIGPAPRLR